MATGTVQRFEIVAPTRDWTTILFVAAAGLSGFVLGSLGVLLEGDPPAVGIRIAVLGWVIGSLMAFALNTIQSPGRREDWENGQTGRVEIEGQEFKLDLLGYRLVKNLDELSFVACKNRRVSLRGTKTEVTRVTVWLKTPLVRPVRLRGNKVGYVLLSFYVTEGAAFRAALLGRVRIVEG